MRNRLFLFTGLILFAMLACAESTPSAPTVSADDAMASAVAMIQQTQTALVGPSEIQPTQSSKAELTVTSEPTATQEINNLQNHYAWNNLATQDSGGVSVQIARLVIAEKSSIKDQNFSAIPLFDNTPVVGEIVFVVQNNTKKVISIYPDQATVIAGSEQIDLSQWMFFTTFGEDYSGDIYPGVSATGGIWFGLKRTPLDQIQSLTIAFDAPFDADFNSLVTLSL
jgi:hypothetical protein